MEIIGLEVFLLGRYPLGACGTFRLREKPEPGGDFFSLSAQVIQTIKY